MPLNDAMRERLEGWKEVAMALAPLLLGEVLAETPDVLRARYNLELARNLPPAGVTVSPVDMGGVPGALVTPAEPREGKVMLYIHGGGYFSGGSAGYHGIAGHFAELLGASVYIPDYRLAPEHLFPAPLDDVSKAYAWLAADPERADRIVLAGDSAGGAMVVSAMVRARNAGLPLPAGGVAISP
jgi:acetyl esterase/lipase